MRHGANFQDVIFARNVDGDNESKFYEEQPSADTPVPATFINGLDFHFDAPMRAVRRETQKSLRALPRRSSSR